MKILGIGVDIVQNKRIRASIRNKAFIKRIYTKNEIELSYNIKDKIRFFSKRFAAKESLVKAIGTGFRNDINFKDIQILNSKLGKPYYSNTKKISEIIKRRFKIRKFHLFLSITDEKDYSIAFTILQK